MQCLYIFMRKNVKSASMSCNLHALIGPPYPHARHVVKRDSNGFPYKGWCRVGAWTGTLKNLTKSLWRWGPTVGLTSSFRLHIYIIFIKLEKEEVAQTHVYVWEHQLRRSYRSTWWIWRSFVIMKYSWSLTSVYFFSVRSTQDNVNINALTSGLTRALRLCYLQVITGQFKLVLDIPDQIGRTIDQRHVDDKCE